ncbi:S8 family peptidase [Candidatus Albibeggiatoa sp. nov. NOAA]|uniref:S8 family peptidase n=1 Tax=Candidatus Albibeggiatoa sp. nov. NOAA TaxID=3162724 RepID=UPI0032F956EF|nr:S8 family serine peptidase [Thiotrichaceae bacterium]
MSILRHAVVLPVMLASSTTWAALTTPIGATAQHSFVENQVIIKFKDDGIQSLDDTITIRQTLGVFNIQEFPLINAQLWEMTTDTLSALQFLENDPRIEYIEPNYIVSLNETPNDPDYSKLWGLHNEGQTGGKIDADIDAPEAWEINTDSDVIVAVIDTGVAYSHPDLAPNMWVNKGEIPDNGVDDDQNGYIDDVYGYDFVNDDGDPDDDHYHGTHVAGTVAAVGNNGTGVVGVSWTAKIMALKFLNKNGSGSTSDAIKAVQYATSMGAKLTNNSWGGGGYSQALYDAIEEAQEKDVLFIAAAGNARNDNDGSPTYPASYDLDNIITVAATDHNDNLAAFSNYGHTSVDLGAPGVNIYSTIPGDSYKSLNGTSMATPQVAGAITLLWSQCSTLTSSDIKDTILKTLDSASALIGKTVTGGRLNISNALASCIDDDGDDDTCKHAVYETDKGLITMPYLDIPLLDPITGEPTGDIAVFEGELSLIDGVEDLVVVPDNTKFIKMLDGDDNECHASYSYADRIIHIPFVDVPSVMVLPPNIIVPGPTQVFEATLQQLPLSSDVFHLQEYNYLDTLD